MRRPKTFLQSEGKSAKICQAQMHKFVGRKVEK